MNNTKILITIDWFLPGTLSGGPVRSYANLIEHLSSDFQFYIVTRNTDYGSTEPYKGIQPNTWVDYNEYTKIYYIDSLELNKSHLNKIFNSIDFDVVYVNGIYSWYFSILPVLLLKKKKQPIIVSARGMLNPQAFSVKKTKKKIYLKLAKLFGFYKGVRFHATNTDEALHVKSQINQDVSVSIAPNLPRKLSVEINKNNVKQTPTSYVNIARISIEKGTLKMLQGLQAVKEPLTLDIYGPIYDKLYWEKCEVLISKMPNHIKVNYNGVIDSAEVPKTLLNYDFFILMSEGENFGHAILEALSAGLPVIISNKTPWKNLENKTVGWDIDVSNKSEILRVYNEANNMSQDLYAKWSESAFVFAKKFTENQELLEQNKALFLDAINN